MKCTIKFIFSVWGEAIMPILLLHPNWRCSPTKEGLWIPFFYLGRRESCKNYFLQKAFIKHHLPREFSSLTHRQCLSPRSLEAKNNSGWEKATDQNTVETAFLPRLLSASKVYYFLIGGLLPITWSNCYLKKQITMVLRRYIEGNALIPEYLSISEHMCRFA